MADTLHYVGRARFAPVRTWERLYESLAWPYILALPFMYAIGFYVMLKKALLKALGIEVQLNCWFVDGLSINSRRMKEGATRWPSLNTCYNFSVGEGRTALHRALDTCWMHIRNAQAVRNRLKIAKRELAVAVRAIGAPGRPVRILSLAAGTAQGVIEVAAESKRFGIDCEIVLVDHDVTALRYARDLADRNGVEIKTIEGNVLMFNKFIGPFTADIVEMMGFLDYLDGTLGEKLLRKIWRHLQSGSYFFCCHIHPNGERYFLKYVVDWDSGMLYRTVPEFKEVLHKGNFLTPRIVTEPLGIHSVSVARKE